MKKKERGSLPIVLLTLLVLLTACRMISTTYSSAGYLEEPGELVSPDKKRVAIVELITSKRDLTKYLTLRLIVQDNQTGQRLLETNTGASIRMRWSLKWLSNSEVQLESSDIGTYCWQEVLGTGWVKATCSP